MDATQLSLEFFDAYRQQDIESMVALFHPEATIRYVPFAMEGGLEEAGVSAWGGLIDAFPDLSNRVEKVWDAGTTAFARVYISGTQAKDAFGVPNRGRRYDLEHLFVIETDDGKIVHMTSYWDNAEWLRQLGQNSL
ncbi:MAG: ester cyclase [Planctomycetota bacterium]